MKRTIFAYLLAAFAVILGLSLISFNYLDNSFILDATSQDAIKNWCGSFGAYTASIFLYFFGCSALLLVPVLGASAILIQNFTLYKNWLSKLLALTAFVPVIATLFAREGYDLYASVYPGGLLGAWGNGFCEKYNDKAHIDQFLAILIWALGIILLRDYAMHLVTPFFLFLKQLPVGLIYTYIQTALGHIAQRVKAYLKQSDQAESEQELIQANIYEDPFWDEFLHPAQKVDETVTVHVSPFADQSRDVERIDSKVQKEVKIERTAYTLPHAGLLSIVKEEISDTQMRKENETQARALEHKLEQFGIHGKVVAINQGPAITLFEYQPTIDTKISNILARENDLALALQALSLRIIAPIAGKSVVGFEVARTVRKTIFFSEIFSNQQFTKFSGLLPLVIGKDTLGRAIVCDMARMPHLLIAGSTGSGKSIGLHALILSLLCSKNPEEVRLILVDPKRLEFSPYADIPHLLFPIVTDPKKAVQVLTWAVRTMEERYALMAQAGVRNIEEYQKKFSGEMSFIVIIIDELADLMMTSGKEVEHLIARLAQMARAAGMHIIVATQRPSVDIITGVIKVNFPSRIAFKVTSKVDSRTIIDGMGAEKLLGKGDMLFLDSSGAIQRIQGVYVPESDITSVVNYIKSQRTVVYEELHIPEQAQISDEECDALFDQVISYVKGKDEISISLLQRVFKIGYNRSARIIEQLEAGGYIHQADGSKMRKVVKER